MQVEDAIDLPEVEIIRKTRKNVSALTAILNHCKLYNSENAYSGREVDPQEAWAKLTERPYAKIIFRPRSRDL